MDRFVRELITEWRRLHLPVDGEGVIVAVSGGADSASLLAGVAELVKRKKLRLAIIAAYFDHGIRADSRADLEFVRGLASRFGFEFAESAWKAPKRGNLEQAARLARYEFLRSVAGAHDARSILTGHTMNDQAETVLINLIRGSGETGLSGMRPVRQLEGGAGRVAIARPLMRWAKRADTEEFCKANEIDFRRDAMNHDPTFRRVWIRKKLIPMLEQANPKIIETLCRTASVLGANLNDGSVAPPEIPKEPRIRDLKTLAGVELSSYLRAWLGAQKGSLRRLGQKHIAAIERLLVAEKSGRIVQVPGGEVVMAGGRLKWRQNRVEK